MTEQELFSRVITLGHSKQNKTKKKPAFFYEITRLISSNIYFKNFCLFSLCSLANTEDFISLVVAFNDSRVAYDTQCSLHHMSSLALFLGSHGVLQLLNHSA